MKDHEQKSIQQFSLHPFCPMIPKWSKNGKFSRHFGCILYFTAVKHIGNVKGQSKEPTGGYYVIRDTLLSSLYKSLYFRIQNRIN